MKNKNFKIFVIVCMIISIALMALPYSVLMIFILSEYECVYQYCSYFSLTPFGYGNVFPVITAVLSIIVLQLLIVNVKEKVRTGRTAIIFIFSLIIICPIFSWLIVQSFSWLGLLIFILHITALILYVLSDGKSSN